MTMKVKKIEAAATYYVDHGAEEYQPGRYGVFDGETRVGTIFSDPRRFMDPAQWNIQTYRNGGFGSHVRSFYTLREAKAWVLNHPEKFGRRLIDVFSDAPAPDAHLDDDSILEMPGEDLE